MLLLNTIARGESCPRAHSVKDKSRRTPELFCSPDMICKICSRAQAGFHFLFLLGGFFKAIVAANFLCDGWTLYYLHFRLIHKSFL